MTASSCGSGLIAWGSCKAGESVLSGLGHALVNVLAWPLRAFVSPGQAPTGQQLLATASAVATAVAARAWRQRTPFGVDLRDAAGLIAGAVQPHPALARYLAEVGRGAGRVLEVAGRAVSWAAAHRHGRFGRLLLMLVVGYVVVGAAAHLFGWLPGVVLVPAAVHAVAVLGRRPTPSRDWWSEPVLVGALQAAGIVPKPRVGETPAALRRHGPPQHDATGTAVRIGLPGAATHSAVQTHREQLAAALRVPAAALTITQDATDPANVITVHVRAATAPEPTPPDDAARRTERWGDPLRVGVDRQGRDVMLTTTGLHTLLAGATGSGKTVAARRIVARALLDPAVRIVMLDGKGSGADWAGLLPLLAEPPVQIGEPDLGRRAVELIGRVLAVNRGHDGQRHRANAAGCLLIAEEWAAFRSSVPAGVERRDLDEAMTRLLQLGRSAGTHVLLIAQRPTRTSLPTDQAANVRQRLVVPCASDEEASHALGEWPVVANLRRPGAGLLVNADPQRQVAVDNLTDDVWEALCTRAAVLRARPVDLTKPVQPVQPVLLTKPDRQEPEPVPAAAAQVDVDPLLDAVTELLEQDGDRGLSAAVLRDLLPDGLRPASASQLGKELARFPGHLERATVTDPGTRRSRLVWRRISLCAPPDLPVRAADLPTRAPDLPTRADRSPYARSPRAGGKSGQTDRLVPAQGGEASLPADTPGQLP